MSATVLIDRLPAPTLPVVPAAPNNDIAFWNVIKDSPDPAAFEAYLSNHPSGQFAAQARARVSELRGPPQPVDDFAADSNTIASVAVGANVTGAIEREGDQDWFRAILTAGATYVIRQRGSTSGGTLVDSLITGIFGPDSRAIPGTSNDDADGKDSRVTFTPTSSGTYFIAAAGYGNSTGTYTLSLTEVSPAPLVDDFVATLATTGSVELGGSVRGAIERAGDRDWLRATLTAGVTYVIRLRGVPGGGGTLADPLIVGVFGATGAAISGTSNDDADGKDSRVTFTPTSSGTYFVAAAGYGNSTGTYTLSLTALSPVDDFVATLATTGSVEIGGSVRGAIERAGDRDWLRATLTAGVTYVIRLRGVPGGGGTLADPLIVGVFGATGAAISGTTNDDAEGKDSRVTFTPSTSGSHFIAVGGYGSSAGTYTLSVIMQSPAAPQLADDFVATTATKGAISVGGNVTGTIERTGDQDWFRTNLTAGMAYVIRQRGTAGGGSLADPVLVGVYGPNGQLIPGTYNDDADGKDARTTFVPAVSGAYYIAAGAYGGGTGSYSVSIAIR